MDQLYLLWPTPKIKFNENNVYRILKSVIGLLRTRKMRTRKLRTEKCAQTYMRTRKVRTWKSAHTEKCAHGKMRTRKNAHTEKCAHGKMRTRKIAHMTLKILKICANNITKSMLIN